MSEAYSHNDLISVEVLSGTARSTVTGFGGVLLIVPLSTNSLAGADSSGVGSYDSVYATFSSYTEAAAANTATSGSLSSETLLGISTFFAQRTGTGARQRRITVLAVDLASGHDTYHGIIPTFDAVDDSWYGLCVATRTITLQDDICTAVADLTRPVILCLQTADSTAIASSGWDATAVGALSETILERVTCIYNSNAAAWDDLEYLGALLAVDPDKRSSPGDIPIASTTSLPTSTSLTQTQKGYLRTNFVNVALPYGNATKFVDAGVMLSGRPIYETITADWFKVRLAEDFANAKVNLSRRNEKWVMDATGQNRGIDIITARYEKAVAAGHFLGPESSPVISAEDIDDAAIAARTLSWSCSFQYATSARIFSINVYADRSSIA